MFYRIHNKSIFSSIKYFVLLFLCFILVNNYMFGKIPNRISDISNEKKIKRTVVLKEVMQIQDDGEKVIFKNPHILTLLEDGSLIFYDYPHIFKYNKDGKFVFKILKKGNGPKECQNPSFYFVDGNQLFVHSWIPPKILVYDLNGKYLKEYRVPSSTFSFLKLIDNKIYGIRNEIRYSNFLHKEGIYETPYSVYEITNKFKKFKKIQDIPVKHYIKKARWQRRTLFSVLSFEHYLFFIHTSEYKISRLNLRTGKIDKVFKRPYTRIKSEVKEGEEQDIYNPVPRDYRPPPLKYVFDVWWIQIYKNSLWVFTSTQNGQKRLIDVFDLNGNYVDCFYLKYPDNNCYHKPHNIRLSDDGYFYVPEENKETGLFSINKYAIKD